MADEGTTQNIPAQVTTAPVADAGSTREIAGGAIPAPGSGSSADLNRAEFASWIPESYRHDTDIQNLMKTDNPKEEFLKQFQNQRSMIGSRPQGIVRPADNATPEEWSNFHKQLGVPDDLNLYEMPAVEWGEEDKAIGEFLGKTRSDDFLNELKAEAQKAGMTPRQWKHMAETYDKLFVKQHRAELEQMAQEAVQADQAFDTAMRDMYGDKVMDVMATGKKLLSECLPDRLKPLVAQLDSKSLAVMTGALYGISSKFLQEDTFNKVDSNPAGSAPMTMNEFNQKIQGIMMQKGYTDHTHADHKLLKEQIDYLYENVYPLLVKNGK